MHELLDSLNKGKWEMVSTQYINDVVPLIIPYNCIYALDNPEVFADVPDYISVDTSSW